MRTPLTEAEAEFLATMKELCRRSFEAGIEKCRRGAPDFEEWWKDARAPVGVAKKVPSPGYTRGGKNVKKGK